MDNETALDREYLRGYRAAVEAAVKLADNAAVVEECADDTAAGRHRAEPYRRIAKAIRTALL